MSDSEPTVKIELTRNECRALRQAMFAGSYLVEVESLPGTAPKDTSGVNYKLADKIAKAGEEHGFGKARIALHPHMAYPIVPPEKDSVLDEEAFAQRDALMTDLRDVGYEQISQLFAMRADIKFMKKDGKDWCPEIPAKRFMDWYFDERNPKGGPAWSRVYVWRGKYLKELKENGIKNLKFSWRARLRMVFWRP